jgi:hypothetical protein
MNILSNKSPGIRCNRTYTVYEVNMILMFSASSLQLLHVLLYLLHPCSRASLR